MLHGITRAMHSREGDGQGLVEYVLVLVVISLMGIYFCYNTGNDAKRLILHSNESLSTIS